MSEERTHKDIIDEFREVIRPFVGVPFNMWALKAATDKLPSPVKAIQKLVDDAARLDHANRRATEGVPDE